MENNLEADKGGVVKRVLVEDGDVMSTDQPIIEFAAEGEAAPAEAQGDVKADGPIMKAPMGGTVLEIKVKVGDAVKAGDTLLTYEAMKMENNLVSERDGVIAKILVEDGDVMATDQPIIQFGTAGAAAPAPAPKAAAPKPAPRAAEPIKPVEDKKYDVKPVAGVDVNRAIAPTDGGTAERAVLPNVKRKGDGNAIRIAEGTTLEININPDGGINIRITKQ